MSFVVDAIGRRWSRVALGRRRRRSAARPGSPTGAGSTARRRPRGAGAGERAASATAASASGGRRARAARGSRAQLEALAGLQRLRVDVGVQLLRAARRRRPSRARSPTACRRVCTMYVRARHLGSSSSSLVPPLVLVCGGRSTVSSRSSSRCGVRAVSDRRSRRRPRRTMASGASQRAGDAAGMREPDGCRAAAQATASAKRPRRARRRSASARAASAGAPPACSWARTIERDAVTSPAGAARGERGRQVLDAAALRADARAAGTARAASARAARARCSGAVAPTTAPTSLSRPSPSPPSRVDERGHALPDRPAAGELRVLDVGGARVGRAHEHEDARAGPRAPRPRGPRACRAPM